MSACLLFLSDHQEYEQHTRIHSYIEKGSFQLAKLSFQTKTHANSNAQSFVVTEGEKSKKTPSTYQDYQVTQPRHSEIISKFYLGVNSKSNVNLDVKTNLKPGFLTMLMSIENYLVCGGGARLDSVSGPSLFAYLSSHSDLLKAIKEYDIGNMIQAPIVNYVPLICLQFHAFDHELKCNSFLLRDQKLIIQNRISSLVYKEVFRMLSIRGIPEIINEYLSSTVKDNTVKDNTTTHALVATTVDGDKEPPFNIQYLKTFLPFEDRNALALSKHGFLFLEKQNSFQINIDQSHLKQGEISASVVLPMYTTQLWFFIIGKRKTPWFYKNKSYHRFELFDILDQLVESSELTITGDSISVQVNHDKNQSLIDDKIMFDYPLIDDDITSCPYPRVHTKSFSKCNPDLLSLTNSSVALSDKYSNQNFTIRFSDEKTHCYDLSEYESITLHYGMFNVNELDYDSGMVGKRFVDSY